MIRIILILALLSCNIIVINAQAILVPPYIQPGDAAALTKEKKIVIWQTDSVSGQYKVEYALVTGAKKPSVAKVTFKKLHLLNKTTLIYRATLPNLKFDSDYSYKVSLNNKQISEGTFTTRTKTNQTKFAVFGDCGAGTPQQAKIAYQMYQQKPQFVLVTGDNVYGKGLEREYRKNFFPYYLANKADTLSGAPLLQSTPFYMLVGNHDLNGADLDKFPDGLAYFYYNDLPLNGHNTKNIAQVKGDEKLVKAFMENSESRFPTMTNYSFDYGNVHIVCLDANPHSDPTDPEFIKWLSNDLNKSKADWKIVAYHHPGFNSSKAHYDYQMMRLLSPVLERLKVDMVVAGHVHNYQRSLPLTFEPKKDSTGVRYDVTKSGYVDGKFTLDQNFDGVKNTKAKGIVYIVTGAGGARLYDPTFTDKPDLWKHENQQNWVPFTAKMISDKHSFTMIETTGKKLVLKQFDHKGNVLDAITMTK